MDIITGLLVTLLMVTISESKSIPSSTSGGGTFGGGDQSPPSQPLSPSLFLPPPVYADMDPNRATQSLTLDENPSYEDNWGSTYGNGGIGLWGGFGGPSSPPSATTMDNAILNYLYTKHMIQRMKQQVDASNQQRKRNNGNYWKMCAFNAVSCFG